MRHELLGRQEVQTLLDGYAQTIPRLWKNSSPDLLTIGEIQKVLQNLLREGVPIRNFITILETLADTAAITRDTDYLTGICTGSPGPTSNPGICGERAANSAYPKSSVGGRDSSEYRPHGAGNNGDDGSSAAPGTV